MSRRYIGRVDVDSANELGVEGVKVQFEDGTVIYPVEKPIANSRNKKTQARTPC
jgi:hypothetical protein